MELVSQQAMCCGATKFTADKVELLQGSSASCKLVQFALSIISKQI